MNIIIGAILGYCLFSGALVVIISMHSSRLSQAEAYEEDWRSEEARSPKQAGQRLSGVSSTY